jgi:hypothetical protein
MLQIYLFPLLLVSSQSPNALYLGDDPGSDLHPIDQLGALLWHHHLCPHLPGSIEVDECIRVG